MAPPKGNDYASACKGKENKRKAFKAYCEWIASGRLCESFCWKSEDGKARCTYKMIRYWYQIGEDVLEPLLEEEAHAKNLQYWEELGMSIANNRSKGEGWVWANNMFNRFKNKIGWRLTDKSVEDENAANQQQAKEDKVAAMAEEINGSK